MCSQGPSQTWQLSLMGLSISSHTFSVLVPAWPAPPPNPSVGAAAATPTPTPPRTSANRPMQGHLPAIASASALSALPSTHSKHSASGLPPLGPGAPQASAAAASAAAAGGGGYSTPTAPFQLPGGVAVTHTHASSQVGSRCASLVRRRAEAKLWAASARL